MFLELAVRGGLFKLRQVPTYINVYSISSMDVYPNKVILNVRNHGNIFAPNVYSIPTNGMQKSYDIVNQINKYAANGPKPLPLLLE